MLETIKEAGIFIVIAQAVLYFVPGETYVKYVKVMIGILMMAWMLSPLFSFITEGKWEEIERQAFLLEKALLEEREAVELGENEMGIYSGIEEELKNRLAMDPPEGYEVLQVSLREERNREEGPGMVEIRLRPLPAGETGGQREGDIQVEKAAIEQVVVGEEAFWEKAEDEEEIKAHCEKVLGVTPERMEIAVCR